MEIRVEEETSNASIGRKEIKFSILESNTTPSKEAVKQALCKKLNVSPDSTIIVRIDQQFGAKQGKGIAHSYKDAQSLKKFEPDYFAERTEKKAKKAAAKGGAAPEAKAEAAPAPKEEKKEAKKEEKKE